MPKDIFSQHLPWARLGGQQFNQWPSSALQLDLELQQQNDLQCRRDWGLCVCVCVCVCAHAPIYDARDDLYNLLCVTEHK